MWEEASALVWGPFKPKQLVVLLWHKTLLKKGEEKQSGHIQARRQRISPMIYNNSLVGKKPLFQQDTIVSCAL